MSIGGLMDYSKLMPTAPAVASAESGSGIPVQHRTAEPSLCYDQHARHDFAALTPEEQQAAVRTLALQCVSDHSIAGITGLHVEQIRRLLSEAAATAA
jgi:hypothetical protein